MLFGQYQKEQKNTSSIFDIIKINGTFYFWFGIIMLTVSGILLWLRRSITSFLFFYAIIFFLPALPVAMSIIEAWTPLGERYLYISSFGACFLVVIMIERIPWKKELANSLMALLLSTAAFITVNRNIVWQNNFTLFEDTVKKSPESATARNEYAIALFNIGRTHDALEQFNISATLAGKIKYRELPSLNAIEMEISRNSNPGGISKDYLGLLETVPEASTEIRRKFVRFLNSQVIREKDPAKVKALYKEMLSQTEKLFSVERNGFYAYRLGQLHLALGEKEEAVEYFKKAVELSPNDFFSDPARKLIARLDGRY